MRFVRIPGSGSRYLPSVYCNADPSSESALRYGNWIRVKQWFYSWCNFQLRSFIPDPNPGGEIRRIHADSGSKILYLGRYRTVGTGAETVQYGTGTMREIIINADHAFQLDADLLDPMIHLYKNISSFRLIKKCQMFWLFSKKFFL